MIEVSRFTCGECKFFGKNCKCIDHSKIHFARSCFSCDEYTANHDPCVKFDCVEHYPAKRKEWEDLGGFWNWFELYRQQWHRGKHPITTGIILTKPRKENREVFDDIWDVSYDDFLNCNIMREDGIHYVDYRHIERTSKDKNPIGYVWISEGEGILSLEDLE